MCLVFYLFIYFAEYYGFPDIYTYISVWICENVATEISLIYPLTESRRRAFFFSQLPFVYLIGNG